MSFDATTGDLSDLAPQSNGAVKALGTASWSL
jgi:hypothetical protein